MHKLTTPADLIRLSEWASRNTPPSYQWFHEFGKIATDGVYRTGHDIQSGDSYSLFVGKKQYYFTSIERRMEEIAYDLLTKHQKCFEVKRTVAHKTRSGMNIRDAWYVEHTIIQFDGFGFPSLAWSGACCSVDLESATASSVAIALCRALAHVASEQLVAKAA